MAFALGATLVVLAFSGCPSVTWQGESDTKLISIYPNRCRDAPIMVAGPKPFYSEKSIRYSLPIWRIVLAARALISQGSLFIPAPMVDAAGVEPAS